ncbi:hypothetical protein DIU36_20120 [Mucilaginibacter rubeus]|nr:hypothetical protein DIU36_20120 [Mucilaginibacter rubeus]
MTKPQFSSQSTPPTFHPKPKRRQKLEQPVIEYVYVEDAEKLAKAYAILFEAIINKRGNKL